MIAGYLSSVRLDARPDLSASILGSTGAQRWLIPCVCGRTARLEDFSELYTATIISEEGSSLVVLSTASSHISRSTAARRSH